MLIVYPCLFRIHSYQRITNDVFQERAGVYLSQDKTHGVRRGIREHDEFVARNGFEHM